MRLKMLVGVLLAAGLVAAGCGDDDETTTTTTTEGASGASGASGAQGAQAGGGLLPDDFATEANAICEAGNEELEAKVNEAFGGGQGEPSQAELDEYVDEQFVPIIQGQIDAITALGAPEEGADELTTALDDAQSALGQIEADPSSLTGGGDPFKEVEAQFKELGLPACASD